MIISPKTESIDSALFSNKNVYIRFQGTKNIEKKSEYTDLDLIEEDYKDGYDRNELIIKYWNSLILRSGITPAELVEHAITGEFNESIDYRVNGVFAMRLSDFTLEELLSPSITNIISPRSTKYLIIFEGTEIMDFGGSDGIVVTMDKILKIYKPNFLY